MGVLTATRVSTRQRQAESKQEGFNLQLKLLRQKDIPLGLRIKVIARAGVNSKGLGSGCRVCLPLKRLRGSTR